MTDPLQPIIEDAWDRRDSIDGTDRALTTIRFEGTAIPAFRIAPFLGACIRFARAAVHHGRRLTPLRASWVIQPFSTGTIS